MSRHPQSSLWSPEATNLGRATVFNQENVQEFYKNLRILLERGPFGPESIYNVHQTGVTTVHRPQKIIARKGQKLISKTTYAERNSLLRYKCVGKFSATVLYISSCENVGLHDPRCSSQFHRCDTYGWMITDNFVKYLDNYIKYVKWSTDKKCILTLDNHDSHISPNALNTCKINGIHLLTQRATD